jgi:hypothetical protein
VSAGSGVGFNWYLDARVRIQFNWEHSWFDQPAFWASAWPRWGTTPSGQRWLTGAGFLVAAVVCIALAVLAQQRLR